MTADESTGGNLQPSLLSTKNIGTSFISTPSSGNSTAFSRNVSMVEAVCGPYLKKNYLLYELKELKITVSDFASLLPGVFINDTIINCVLLHLMQEKDFVQSISASLISCIFSFSSEELNFCNQIDLSKKLIFLPLCERSY